MVENAQQLGQKPKESVAPVRADLKRRIFFSRRRVGWCEFSARFLSTRVLPMLHSRQDLTFRCPITLQFIRHNHARNVVEPIRGACGKKRFAACVLRRLWTRISSTLPSWSTALQRECVFPLIFQYTRIQVPLVPTLRTSATEFVRVCLTKL